MDDFETCVTNIQYIELRLGTLTSALNTVQATAEQKKEAAADSRALHTTAKAAHERLSLIGTSDTMGWFRDQVARIGARLTQLDDAIKAWGG